MRRVRGAFALRCGPAGNDFGHVAVFPDDAAGGAGEVVQQREHAEGEAGEEVFGLGVADGAQLAVVELPSELGRGCEEVGDELPALGVLVSWFLRPQGGRGLL